MVITRAAIMYANGEVLGGRNYGEIASLGSRLGLYGEKILGFLTNSDRFVLPEEAAEIAIESKQIDSVEDTLSPEDLWPESEISVEC